MMSGPLTDCQNFLDARPKDRIFFSKGKEHLRGCLGRSRASKGERQCRHRASSTQVVAYFLTTYAERRAKTRPALLPDPFSNAMPARSMVSAKPRFEIEQYLLEIPPAVSAPWNVRGAASDPGCQLLVVGRLRVYRVTIRMRRSCSAKRSIVISTSRSRAKRGNFSPHSIRTRPLSSRSSKPNVSNSRGLSTR